MSFRYLMQHTCYLGLMRYVRICAPALGRLRGCKKKTRQVQKIIKCDVYLSLSNSKRIIYFTQ